VRRIAESIDANDASMLDLSKSERLKPEPLEGFLIDVREHLERDLTLDGVAGLVDDAHSALADLRDDLVLPVDDLARWEKNVV
jgi:hypothetical protein